MAMSPFLVGYMYTYTANMFETHLKINGKIRERVKCAKPFDITYTAYTFI